MAEYIEREALLQKKTTMTEYDEGGWGVKVSVVRTEDIKAIPAADVAPVVHGRWIHDINNLYGCSECMERETMSPKKLKAYCPNCGARMDGE